MCAFSLQKQVNLVLVCCPEALRPSSFVCRNIQVVLNMCGGRALALALQERASGVGVLFWQPRRLEGGDDVSLELCKAMPRLLVQHLSGGDGWAAAVDATNRQLAAEVLLQDNHHRLALLPAQTRGALGRFVGTGVGLAWLVLSGGVALEAVGGVLSAGIPLASVAGSALEDMGWQAYGSWQPRLRNTGGGEPKFESSNTCSGIAGG